jgi:hypothetical protein
MDHDAQNSIQLQVEKKLPSAWLSVSVSTCPARRLCMQSLRPCENIKATSFHQEQVGGTSVRWDAQ